MRSRSTLVPVIGMIFQSAAPTAAFDRSEAVFIESDVVHLFCEVFLDTNEDGVRQQGESGLPGVFVTNGVDLIATDTQGRAAISVDRAVYRFATLTIPAGHWPTTSWYAPLPIGSPPPALVEFGLKEFPQTASDPIRWVHISDTQTESWGEIPAVEEDFQQINKLADPPLFLINTGDLVEVGSDTTHWNHYLDQLTTSAWPVFHIPGNHDTLGTGPPLGNYELYVGPPYYNLRAGSWNFLFLNTERPAAASPRQDRWLEHAIAATPPGTRHVAFQHRALSELPSADAVRLADLGIEATFSGHWHALQIARHRQGVLDFNLSRTSVGPLDRTPRSFAIVTLDASSGIDYELRRLRVDHRATVVHPRPDQEVGGDRLEVLVQAYDTSSPVRDLAVVVQTGPYSSSANAMSQEGISLWRAMVPVDGVPWGNARAMVTGAFDDGTPIQLEVSFVRSEVVSIRRELGEDWPMFRKSAGGSSFTATPVDPPLALAWATPLPGMVALNSPVVGGGRVFLGCRTESADLDDSGILCCDAATGAPLWYHSLPGGIALAPSVAEDLLLVSTMTDSIFALDAATGDIAWSGRTPGNKYKMTAPVWSGDDSWFGSEPTPVEIDWRSGMSRWTTEPLGSIWYPAIYSAPAVSPQRVYFSFYGTPGASRDGFSVVNRASGMVVHAENGSFRSPIWTGS
ncbi:MAG: metallophosphoesterase, partial [bacterium]